MNNLKLGVDMDSAHNLLPKDREGSSNAFAELYFDGQRFRTTIKEKDLNPVWNESFYFNISDLSNLHYLTLEVYVNNNVKATYSSIFSHVRGKLGLKVYVTDDPSIKSYSPVPSAESLANAYPSTAHGHTEAISNPNHASSTPDEHYVPKYEANKMKQEQPQPTKLVHMHSVASSQPVDFALKETSPYLGGGRVVCGHVIHGDKTTNTYDLVERMYFLYVRVVKARELPAMDVTRSLDLFVEVKIGNYRGITKHFEKQQNPMRPFLMHGIFYAATPVDSTPVASTSIRSKVYDALRLWYVHNNLIEAQDLFVAESNRFLESYVKARNLNPFWNEDLLFVTSEPFEDHLIILVEDHVNPGRDEIIRRVILPLNVVDRHDDDRMTLPYGLI
ncbi:multiple C2 and transmembrane domain-containing protein 1 [Pyrus ussuriensis x Pyrus communis]|uniref:Multiple C2 and transmembrane domain-containing protein 1 n=1 Tax=Pyrus ussuriensis x Pyrus communis TaxID=2448454 RepID=A0A5N5G0H0_9ROSA|nr:multiple C2 and transmembrane domain-containing protein 1 [Pyrus ussuriensis x Pyrus communis]